MPIDPRIAINNTIIPQQYFENMVLRKLFERIFLRSSVVTLASSAAIPSPLLHAKLRPFNRFDSETCRNMRGTSLTQTEKNPGIRVSPNYISEQEATALVQCALDLKKGYGFRSSEAQDVLAVESSRSSTESTTDLGYQIMAERVTGRPELPHQKHAPWGYGDNFRRDLVPNVLLNLADKIALDGDYGLSECGRQLRDITINYRDKSMFKLDPHCDPSEDGNNIFIVGLLSDVVLTFTPPSDVDGSTVANTSTAMSIRTAPAAIALRSWTDADIDVYLRQNWLAHFTGEARFPWRHAIRTGVDVGEPYNGVCDWWGNLNTLVRRQPQRISIIFAFA